MTKKELAEIKRRFSLEHNNITTILGRYINNKGEVVSSFQESLVGMNQEKAEKYLSIFKRTLSGEIAQNLLNIDFSPEQVMHGEEHHLLTALKDSSLKNEEAVEIFYQKIQTTLTMGEDEHYLILLIHDGYDVPFKTKNDEDFADASNEVFHYILCSVCPVKMTKPSLAYCSTDNFFHSKDANWVVGMPEMGFMFPAFEERAANIYNAVFYTHDISQRHEDFITAVFGTPSPTPAGEQKHSFQGMLQETLAEECSFDVVQAFHEQVQEQLEKQKEEKKAGLPIMDKKTAQAVLEDCGVSFEKRAAFENAFDEEFGVAAHLPATNIISAKQFEIKTPSVSIKVAPNRTELVQTKIIDGHAYIMVLAEEGVEVNGIPVNISQQ